MNAPFTERLWENEIQCPFRGVSKTFTIATIAFVTSTHIFVYVEKYEFHHPPHTHYFEYFFYSQIVLVFHSQRSSGCVSVLYTHFLDAAFCFKNEMFAYMLYIRIRTRTVCTHKWTWFFCDYFVCIVIHLTHSTLFSVHSLVCCCELYDLQWKWKSYIFIPTYVYLL